MTFFYITFPLCQFFHSHTFALSLYTPTQLFKRKKHSLNVKSCPVTRSAPLHDFHHELAGELCLLEPARYYTLRGGAAAAGRPAAPARQPASQPAIRKAFIAGDLRRRNKHRKTAFKIDCVSCSQKVKIVLKLFIIMVFITSLFFI